MARHSQWEIVQGYLVFSSVSPNALTPIDLRLIYDSDYEAQKDGYTYASWRLAFNLRDALIYIIIGSDKRSFAEIAERSPTPPSLDRLSLATASYHTREPLSTYSFHILLSTLLVLSHAERAGSVSNPPVSQVDLDRLSLAAVSYHTHGSSSTHSSYILL